MTTAGELTFLLREQRDLGSALDRSLVLDAMSIPHQIQATPEERWVLLVRPEDAAAAEASLSAWEKENAPRPEAPRKPDYGESRLGASAALAILAFATFAGLRSKAHWIDRGSADAARILAGEWWRAATALTLHADAGHAAGNAVAMGILLTALARRLGPALAAWLALVSGIAGNVATALVTRSAHVSVGASTAVFGALGVLSALQAPGRRAWLTLGVGIALLGFLGSGARADLFAHLLGFAVGTAEGLALRRATPPRRTLLQPALALTALAPIFLAWWRALR